MEDKTTHRRLIRQVRVVLSSYVALRSKRWLKSNGKLLIDDQSSQTQQLP